MAKARKQAAKPAMKPDTPADSAASDPRLKHGEMPVSWAGDFLPVQGHRCACCKGYRFSRAGSGWCCDACHPPITSSDVIDTRTADAAPDTQGPAGADV